VSVFFDTFMERTKVHAMCVCVNKHFGNAHCIDKHAIVIVPFH
jgi:hypothetical protein